VLKTNKGNIRPISLKFFLDYFADTNSQIRIIDDVEADFVARQFLTPLTWIGRVILTSFKLDNDDFMSALADHIGQTFDIVPSFLYIPASRIRETIKNLVWNIIKVNKNYKKYIRTLT